VRVSSTPTSLFRFPPSALLGKGLHEVIDIFSMWKDSGDL
jgi:hypothetical protein